LNVGLQEIPDQEFQQGVETFRGLPVEHLVSALGLRILGHFQQAPMVIGMFLGLRIARGKEDSFLRGEMFDRKPEKFLVNTHAIVGIPPFQRLGNVVQGSNQGFVLIVDILDPDAETRAPFDPINLQGYHGLIPTNFIVI